MEWIKCSDRTPVEGQLVLCLLDKRIPFDDKIMYLNGVPIFPQCVLIYKKLAPHMNAMFLDNRLHSYNPNYWMPLPEPPKD